MIINGGDSAHIMQVKPHLHSQFEIKDLGHLCYFLGLEVDYSLRRYLLSQHKFISEIFDRADLTYTRTASMSLELNLKLRSDDGDSLPDPS